MVKGITDQKLSVSIKPKQVTSAAKTDFKETLQKVFDSQKDKLVNIPGMPGIYSANPQILAPLDIINASDKIPEQNNINLSIL
ncbi:MAG: hypothetical protein V3T21_04210 [Candidatus Margulisiibacteriota bacterium]